MRLLHLPDDTYEASPLCGAPGGGVAHPSEILREQEICGLCLDMWRWGYRSNGHTERRMVLSNEPGSVIPRYEASSQAHASPAPTKRPYTGSDAWLA